MRLRRRFQRKKKIKDTKIEATLEINLERKIPICFLNLNILVEIKLWTSRIKPSFFFKSPIGIIARIQGS